MAAAPLQPEELTLVDLAKILVRKKYWVIGIFLLVLACTIGFGFTKKVAIKEAEKPQYATSILVGYGTPNSMLETPDAVRDQILRVYWPATVDEFKKKNKPVMEITFEVEPPKISSTNLIRFVTTTDSVDPEAIQEFHRRIADLVIERHKRLLETFKSAVERAANARVASAIYEPFGSEIAAVAEPVITPPPPPVAPAASAISRSTIALGILLGLLCGIAAAFLVHFVDSVRASLAKDRAAHDG